jgi:EmrB/QacA subfamily drug resistance transporter
MTIETHTPDAQGYLSHRQILIVMAGLMAGMFLAALDQSIVGTALPRITSELGGLDKLSWVVTAYLLTQTASTPLWGKISDLYGRKLIFQAAIVIFLIGSFASGAAQDIEELILFRAVQGLGGGGLFALALATMGDIVPPRERGRYGGYFGAVFGTSSVLGPVLGGFFADGPGWRWIFYVNIPIGLIALFITSAALKIPHTRRDHAIDYLGATTIVASVSSLLLFTTWAGPDHGWSSPLALTLVAAGLLLAIAFVLVESRAAEPIIPLELFKISVFSTANLYSFILGFAMFGAIIFLPVYYQVVKGFSPTQSGLGFLPMVVGIFSTSISSGIVMSRTGRYRIFPIVGSITVLVALLLLSQIGVATPYWQTALMIYLFGAGLGFSMQIVVTIVQNAVDRRHMGTATSSVAFFRSMGGTFGAAVFGAILSSRLAVHLADEFGGQAGGAATGGGDVSNNVEQIQQLPEPAHAMVLQAFADALHDVFWWAIPIVFIALVVSFFIKEVPLKMRNEPEPEEVALTH